MHLLSNSISSDEFSRVLELMGLTLHNRLGPKYYIFLKPGTNEPIPIQMGWDMPIADVERILENYGLDVNLFHTKRSSLYQAK